MPRRWQLAGDFLWQLVTCPAERDVRVDVSSLLGTNRVSRANGPVRLAYLIPLRQPGAQRASLSCWRLAERRGQGSRSGGRLSPLVAAESPRVFMSPYPGAAPQHFTVLLSS